ITPKKAEAIAVEYNKLFGIRTIMLYLSKFGIQSVTAISIWKKWGTTAKEVIEDNPYVLCTQDFGLTFEACEEIVRLQNLEVDAIKRMKAAIFYILKGNTYSNGHTCLPLDKLGTTAVRLTDDGINIFDEAIDEEIDDKELAELKVGGRKYIYLPQMFEAESCVAQRVKLMLMLETEVATDYTNEIAKLEKQAGIKYAERQKQAIGEAMNHNLFILTGGPGTGKTTTINAIISLLEKQGKSVVLTAPTGRAAKRMTQVTGHEAKTIHRLLEVDFSDTNNLKFRRNEQNPLPFDTIIVDEVSMVDVLLMQSLFAALRMGSKLVLVGDADQLPSVGAGNVLRDFIACERIACVQLKEIFRQAAESLIVTNAHIIVEGEMPILDVRDKDFFFMNRNSSEEMVQTVVDLCSRRLPKKYGYSPMWDIQVLAPTRIGAAGTTELNKALQQKLNPAAQGKEQITTDGRILRVGDKVMQIKNNYDLPWTDPNGELGTGVYNGDIGLVKMIDKGSKTILVDFEDRVAEYSFDIADQLEHAYAITIHKSQGSEFEAVV
ncbi:MAG: AAA family ATPase, partial [Oscillospiraceae bacterium]